MEEIWIINQNASNEATINVWINNIPNIHGLCRLTDFASLSNIIFIHMKKPGLLEIEIKN